MSHASQEELRRRLFELGFDDVRFASTTQPLKPDGLKQWLSDGMHGEMAWMKRTEDKRLDPEKVLPGVKSIVLLGVSYASARNGETTTEGNVRPRWARYALHDDYHDTMKPALVAAGREIETLCGATLTTIVIMWIQGRCSSGCGQRGPDLVSQARMRC